ncbi:MAG: MarR family transcriptional regulator [Microbacterium sp. 71-36]|uniref:MarR family winged helix-turn-helix transcriptional regulator n=1 Tax=unclassified Microbacterium TaxID=2609290 RepID=UPI000869CB55|nr:MULTISPECIES: MarR family transcriptional regulator [unclassified Microbacterium]MBN9212464.1 MarR family transcriptional regulator [Microbacterium sp.]ODT39233.1 MAG: transcriptional regulator [Microbacterium sp. SCN 71-17]OJV77832.1 MAG: MarR family transcriptional regulator [Microbacterium sp. 71-36]
MGDVTREPDAAREAAVHALEQSFSELMTVFRRFVAEAAERVSPGMLPATFKTLSVVSRFGPMTLSALAERLAADKGFLSRSISELEDLGLVTRTPDPHDRRSRLIAVSELGHGRLAEARAPHESRLHDAMADWSVDDIQHLSVMLHALAVGEVPDRD